jgi:hypothetical protein
VGDSTINGGNQFEQMTDRRGTFHGRSRYVRLARCSVVHTPEMSPPVMLDAMNTVWVIVGSGVVAAVVAAVRWYGRGRPTELGFVSQQWVAENRLSQQHDPRH